LNLFSILEKVFEAVYWVREDLESKFDRKLEGISKRRLFRILPQMKLKHGYFCLFEAIHKRHKKCINISKLY